MKVEHGDLGVNGSQLSVVTGASKLHQDLRHYVLEKMGSDPIHTWYGSLIDGGTTPDGFEVSSMIGEENIQTTHILIEQDLRRIISDYMKTQFARAKADRLVYNKTVLTADEIIEEVSNIEFTPFADSLEVEVTVRTAGNTEIALEVSIPNVGV